jgi:hypothetical protein
MELCCEIEMYAQYGWICPVCGSGVAPTVQRCPCVQLEPKITWNQWVTTATTKGTTSQSININFENFELDTI